MQINEYDITNELGEREYRFDGQQPLIFNNNTNFESLLKHSKSLKSLDLRGLRPPGPSTTAFKRKPDPSPISCLFFILTPATPLGFFKCMMNIS